MAKFFRVFMSVLLGLVIGSAINMALITVSGKVIAPPAGADVTTMEGLKAALPLTTVTVSLLTKPVIVAVKVGLAAPYVRLL